MNRVRLTDTQLRQVIKESVNKILTEMNWKTYANADYNDNINGTFTDSYDFPHDNASLLDMSKKRFEEQYGEGTYEESKKMAEFLYKHPILGRLFKSNKITDAVKDYYRFFYGKQTDDDYVKGQGWKY